MFRKSRVALGAQFLRLFVQPVYFSGRLFMRASSGPPAPRAPGRRGRGVALGAQLPARLFSRPIASARRASSCSAARPPARCVAARARPPASPLFAEFRLQRLDRLATLALLLGQCLDLGAGLGGGVRSAAARRSAWSRDLGGRLREALLHILVGGGAGTLPALASRFLVAPSPLSGATLVL